MEQKKGGIASVCVFCGSSDGSNPNYLVEARRLGKLLGEKGIDLVYGGGSRGLMGAVAESAHNSGAKVIGVTPAAMTQIEGFTLYGDARIVPDMHTRKALMNELSDAFLVLPGGYGTFEELLEVTTWAQLSIHQKPIVVVDVDEFYTPLKALIENGLRAGFVREANSKLIQFAPSASEALDTLAEYHNRVGSTARYKLDWAAGNTDPSKFT
ncbi:hypothetical protein BJ742DRAFT_805211 [Cladochytrium replicatum]|nr:hypothetical protein BJ742DRAFT_805211 [Cladochytrium replicatum]